MSDFSDFIKMQGPVREPERFEELKREDAFVTYLARKVCEEMGHKGAQEIANKILNLAQNDTAFASKISARLKAPIEHETIAQVDALIRSHAILKPKNFYKKIETHAKHKTAARRAPRSIIAPEKQELLQPLLDQMVSFLSGDSAKIGGTDSQVLEVLQAKKKPQELPISKTNSVEFLASAKLWDHALAIVNARNSKMLSFSASSYALRLHLAVIGGLTSVQAFTKTLDPREYEDWHYLERPGHWLPERAKLYAKIIETNTVKALALSRRLNTEKPSVWAVRGNTGAGKSYSIQHDPQFKKALDDRGTASGAINPDTFKGLLKQESRGLSHSQLHKEGVALSYQYAQALGKEAVHATLIIDMRLARKSEVESQVIGRAKEREGEARLLDIDTPLVTSLNRVLTRTGEGDDPIVPLEAIRQGYLEIRSERIGLLEEVQKNETIRYFTFYITDENGRQKLAAKKENGVFEILPGMGEAVRKASEKPNAEEVDAIVDQLIDDNYIRQALARDHIPPDKIAMIERWKGYTVRQALELHNSL